MRCLSLLLFSCLLLLARSVCGQDTYQISGVVKARNGGVLPGAGIYVSGYKLGTVADNKGAFSLPPLRNGTYDLLVQMIGYLPLSRQVTLSGSGLNVELVMEESVTVLNEVVIRPDPDRMNHLRIFRESFIGLTENAKDCQILNQNVLRTSFDPETRILRVSADEFLLIKNKALGYRIKYLLKEFEFNMRSKVIYYAGLPTYEDLKASAARLRRYQKKRLEAYSGSTQHFFRSLYRGQTAEEGFIIHKLQTRKNFNRLPDSIIDANLERLLAARERHEKLVITANDSISFWSNMKRQPAEMTILDRSPINPDTLVRTHNADLRYVQNPDPLYVVYTREREPQEFRMRIGMSLNRPPDMPDYQVSLVNLLSRPLYFYANGEITDPRGVLYEGIWAWEKMADSVPMNYAPPAKQR
ncbi:hypothetical protein C7T94_17605 [Pedobacter yulinensis]|uniref:Carboxypeptidase-like regulatory domain-containing protein n=1 Tax=Pedobacter yulinensis TaxID=2126353 RepID=A0A2T3HHU0_9SPHI|nr:carboxypeptidase-like regulatory domain-containing protein [Pedobacter yulinensis]PST82002.1 hypothetical protein C7T94_17605 [Pedobacter yulinensis]